jgi:gentisate 1,2-dioxygenase
MPKANVISTTMEGQLTQAATTPEDELQSLERDAKEFNFIEFWNLGEVEPIEPPKTAVPFVWHWKDIEPRLMAAASLKDLDNTDRRALLLSNPGFPGKPYATDTLLAAYSLYNSGEEAAVHRHTPSASRFVLSGEGGFTTIEGEKCEMKRGDLIITPAGTWHDHGNEGKDPIIWVDILNYPLVSNLNALTFEFDYSESKDGSNMGGPIPQKIQTIREPANHSQNMYGTGGIAPLFTSHTRGPTEHSPMFVYRWENTNEALQKMRDYEGSLYDGIIVEYTNPATGGPVMPTMSFRSQLLRPSEHTQSHRHISSSIYCVLKGNGYSIVDGEKFEWSENDVFAIPGWKWHEHVNPSKDSDVVLYSVTDEPVFRKLGLFREDRKTASGSVESFTYQ